jgi:hypothetical protein
MIASEHFKIARVAPGAWAEWQAITNMNQSGAYYSRLVAECLSERHKSLRMLEGYSTQGGAGAPHSKAAARLLKSRRRRFGLLRPAAALGIVLGPTDAQ